MGTKIFLVCLALFVVICTKTKPAFYWEHHKARSMRNLLGDTGAAVFYYLLAGFFLVAAIMAP